jgi:predicted nuclease with TOPRIM domain
MYRIDDKLHELPHDAIIDDLKRAFSQEETEALLRVLEKIFDYLKPFVVLREDMEGVKRALERLAEAQAKTEERVNSLEIAVGRLEAAVERLAEAQAKTEERVTRLEAAVERLAEAQAKTEERVNSLEIAVGRLEAAVERLADGMDKLRKQVGGLSETVGGDIEDIAYIVLYDVLKREYGWKVEPLERSWQEWDGELIEVDVFGQAKDPADPERIIWIVGEAKHNLTIKEVERFVGVVERAARNLKGEIFPVCFCYRARPEVQNALRLQGIYLVFSYGKLVAPETATV